MVRVEVLRKRLNKLDGYKVIYCCRMQKGKVHEHKVVVSQSTRGQI